jgi:dienelactone hydrolase
MFADPLGFCIGGPFIWNLLKRAGDRVVAAVPAQPSGYRPELPGLSYNNNMKGCPVLGSLAWAESQFAGGASVKETRNG